MFCLRCQENKLSVRIYCDKCNMMQFSRVKEKNECYTYIFNIITLCLCVHMAPKTIIHACKYCDEEIIIENTWSPLDNKITNYF